MSKPIFIYPQWMSAKRDLYNRLMEAGGVSSRHLDIIDAWMSNHIFEFGCETTIHPDISSDERERYTDHMRRNSMFRLIDEIHKKGLFCEIERGPVPGDYSQRLTTTLLVCGVPSLGVGPGTRRPL